MTKIKICGMRRPADIEAANLARPDYVGFILSEGFRRSVTAAEAEKMAAMLAPGIAAVGVFVNEPVERVASAAGFLDHIQLHGREDNDYIRELKAVVRLPVIQAFRIRTEEDLQRAHESDADILLLDNGTGTGQSFDWSLLKGMTGPAGQGLEESGLSAQFRSRIDKERDSDRKLKRMKRPWILAGGLHADNIAQAVRALHPYAVDLSSGAETDGWKDPVKMRRCVETVRLG